jgi:hypothetical protein
MQNNISNSKFIKISNIFFLVNFEFTQKNLFSTQFKLNFKFKRIIKTIKLAKPSIVYHLCLNFENSLVY